MFQRIYARFKSDGVKDIENEMIRISNTPILIARMPFGKHKGLLFSEIPNDLDSRVAAHNAGTGAKYTRSRRSVELVCSSQKMSKSDAFKREHRVKRLPAHRKPMAITMTI